MEKLVRYLILTGSVLLSSCAYMYRSSLHIGVYNAATGVELWPASYTEKIPTMQNNGAVNSSVANQTIPNPAPYLDYKVINYRSNTKICSDTFQLPDVNKRWLQEAKAKDIPAPPGIIIFRTDGLGIDEGEISNIDWRLYQIMSMNKGVAEAGLLPDAAALPVEDYYTSPFYAYYPVVGISYEQAQQYCAWRSKIITDFITQRDNTIVCEYRLPTEAEWEEAALIKSGLPYGTTCDKLPVRVARESAAYLRKRANIAVSVNQIEHDIVEYNKQQPVRSWINYAQSEPYFLHLASPSYVYQGVPNKLGAFHMLGNAAEMVAERGVTKGGSYRDSLQACQINSRGHFTGPSPTVGFRCVCLVRRVTQ